MTKTKARSVKFNIVVTQKHIDKAEKARTRKNYNACRSCVVAQAVREQTGTKKKVDVTSNKGIYIGDQTFGTTNTKDNEKVQNIIYKFDNRMPIRPIKFKIANLYDWE